MEQDLLAEPRTDPILDEIVERLVAAYQPQRIYLFGSKARGDAGPDSDYDLMVIVNGDAPLDHRRSQLALCDSSRRETAVWNQMTRC